jgi:hypothetical protein
MYTNNSKFSAKQIKEFRSIVKNNLVGKVFYANEKENKLFQEYYSTLTKCSTISKQTKKKNKQKVNGNFYCALSKLNNKSTMSIIRKQFGINGIFKLSIDKLNKVVYYNNHSFELIKTNAGLSLLVDNTFAYNWNITDIIHKSSMTILTLNDINQAIVNSKFKIRFCISKIKDHGTKFSIYK